MLYAEIKGSKLLIDADAPEPLPSFVKVIRTVEWPSEKALEIAGFVFTIYTIYKSIESDVAEIFLEILSLLWFYASDYTIGLVKYVTATGKATTSSFANATVYPPSEHLY